MIDKIEEIKALVKSVEKRNERMGECISDIKEVQDAFCHESTRAKKEIERIECLVKEYTHG